MRGARGGAAVSVMLAAAVPASAGPDRATFLSLLHDGRFEAAARAIRENGPVTSPDDLFFDAFTTYWRLVFDDDNLTLKAELESKLDATVAAAESQGGTAEGALWGGLAHLLLAGLEASERRPFAAAFAAKRAKRLLEVPAIEGKARVDALFGLGTFNYVADTVPSYVKGLRALLFLPKGNRVVGLNQIAAAAAGSRYFAFEARTLLVTIYANRHERLYDRALEERDRLIATYPDRIASAYAAARLDLSLGRNAAAIERLRGAEERARSLGDVDPVVVLSLEWLQARAELASFRPDRVEAITKRALAAGNGLGPELRRDFEVMQKVAVRQGDGIPWESLSPETYAISASAHPQHPLLALLAGDAALRAGRAQEASDWFVRAVKAGLPPDLLTGCQLRQAQAADLLGRRPQALAIYKIVASTSGFIARDAAFYYQQAPFRTLP